MFEAMVTDSAYARSGMPSWATTDRTTSQGKNRASAADTGWRPPAEVLLGHIADADTGAGAALEVAGGAAHHLATSQLTAALATVDQAHATAEALTVVLVAEGLERGLHTNTGLCPRDWVSKRCPWASPHLAGDIVNVAHAVNEPTHAPIAQAVTTMNLSVRRAAAVLRTLARIKPVLQPPDYDKAMTLLIDTATTSTFTDRDLKRASDFLLSLILPAKDHEARAHAARDMRGVNESSLANGTLTRFIVTCDAEGAAIFRAILTSPLAAPQPTKPGPTPKGAGAAFNTAETTPDSATADENAGKDPRTATQRRYDALITVLRRGLAGGENTPTTPKATVQVTIRWDALRQQLTGTGTTTTGDILSPETVRKIACDADLIPIVLGTDNEILAMGRTKRLITPAQRRVLEHRDQHCTFPGCSTPAPWCDAHHVTHWSRGGLSDIPNYALLCGRHHTIVHNRDLMATVTTTNVRWHL